MDKLERIDALLELNVLIRELGLIFNLAQLFLDQLLGTLRKWREARAICTRDRQQVSVSVRQWSRTRSTVVFSAEGKGIFCDGVARGGKKGLCSPEGLAECLHSIHDCGI